MSVINQDIVLDFNDTVLLTLEMAGTNIWKSFALTLRLTEVSLVSATTSISTGISPKDFIGNFSTVIIGRGFSGVLQDIIVYDSPLEDFNVPESSTFLPQCYCQSPSSNSGQQCSEGDKSTLR